MRVHVTHQAHALTLEDRGEGHIHRYVPTCRCGWRGPYGRRHTAERYYRDHCEASASGARRKLRKSGPPPPRQPTPADKLPEAWR